MATYIVISTLTDEGARTLKKNPGRIKEFNIELENMGLKVVDQYVVLGNFDFLTIIEADSEAMVSKAIVEILSRGSVRTMTYGAIPIDEFIGSLK